jgi:hypothetical protein
MIDLLLKGICIAMAVMFIAVALVMTIVIVRELIDEYKRNKKWR